MSTLKNLRALNPFHNIVRPASTKPLTNNDIQPMVHNRNPRNLERLRLADKPTGYGLEKVKRTFWNRLQMEVTSEAVTAKVIYNPDKVVVSASTKELCMKQFLYRGTDRMAYILLAKVFAERCLESGFIQLYSDFKPVEGTKMEKFLEILQEEGITLNEPDQYYIDDIWRKDHEKKPWLVKED